MILSNANFSEDDKVLLECIMDDLNKKDCNPTFENIKAHPLFKKLDNKEEFEKKRGFVFSLSINLKQSKANRDSFIIEIGGSGLDLDNPLHAKFISDKTQKLSEEISTFVKGIELYQNENPSFSCILEQLKKLSCNGN